MREIDARGLNCPAPVIQTKVAIEEEHPDVLKVIVDNDAARQNICRFLESQQFETETQQEGTDFHIFGKQDPDRSIETSATEKPIEDLKQIMIMMATDRIGFGDNELGQKLMISFIKTLKEMGPDLWHLVFVNNGVKLTVDNSPVLEDLQSLESSGLRILVCGTCLNHFNLLERKQVGETTNMLDIVTAMQVADKVINI